MQFFEHTTDNCACWCIFQCVSLAWATFDMLRSVVFFYIKTPLRVKEAGLEELIPTTWWPTRFDKEVLWMGHQHIPHWDSTLSNKPSWFFCLTSRLLILLLYVLYKNLCRYRVGDEWVLSRVCLCFVVRVRCVSLEQCVCVVRESFVSPD